MARYLFVTGKLAEPALRETVAVVAPRLGFEYEIQALGISVAALMTPAWIARHLRVPEGIDRIVLPGYCAGDLTPLRQITQVPVDIGPKDLRDLPEYFGLEAPCRLDSYRMQILAEINHAPRLSWDRLLAQAEHYRQCGADVIDLGCDPAQPWLGIGDTVRRLRDQGYRVSVDSMHVPEITRAVRAGAELVLSVNSSNIAAARDWGCEVVLIPDEPRTLAGLDTNIEKLVHWGVPFRVDPILEPIGLGFAASLGRYLEVRRRYPQVPMLMGIGNLTELTDADSAGINVLLAGFCEELGIGSVLTTEVINWARSSTRELDLARRLVYEACRRGVPAKHLEPRLVLLRDPKLRVFGQDRLRQWAAAIRDSNFRIFAEEGVITLFNHRVYLRGTRPFDLFRTLAALEQIDPSHAFYLGYEMAKAVIALTLHKNYVQDEPLTWGYLTADEPGTHASGEPGLPMSEAGPSTPPDDRPSGADGCSATG
ncbi:MAG: dihydropteroate synthase [Gemmataceae bacterium]